MIDTAAIMDITNKTEAALGGASAPETDRLKDILARAERLEGISLDEAAALLCLEDPEGLSLLFGAAGRVKEAVFGPRIVLFAPLYLSNYCSNDCLYCGFRHSNEEARRKALSPDEAVGQARILSRTGFKRILLVAGEHDRLSGVDYLVRVAEEIYKNTDIRILHVNCAPMPVEDFRQLKSAGYGVYQCFQETYNPLTYSVMHTSARKKDYLFRMGAMDRALEAGFGDVGIGALLGLHDYHYDALATIAHSRHLEEAYGAAAHTISVPRLRPAEGAPLSKAPYPVSDIDFKKIVAVYRLAVPYAGVVISTREPAGIREESLTIGASQVSAGSSTEPGGYGVEKHSTAQFDVSDLRELKEMMAVIAGKGLLPSLCTSCYRSARQGENFLRAASTGVIKDFCTPNAILSLKEYVLDAADGPLTELLESTISRYLAEVDGPIKEDLVAKLARTEGGERDLHY